MDVQDDESTLWQRYRCCGDREAHQLLFIRYSPWARGVARDVYRRIRVVQMEWADYAQNATVGLLEAISRYDSQRGVDFMAYAKPRVRGAVFNGLRVFIDETRSSDFVERRQRERFESLHLEGGGDLLDNLVDSISGLALGLLLDVNADADVFSQGEHVERGFERYQLGTLLEREVARLPENEELVVRLHYYQHLPFVEIAGILGLSKGRISQIHKSALSRLRAMTWVDEFRDSA